eukprot:8205273-Pyramimonas_sp.AAC.1
MARGGLLPSPREASWFSEPHPPLLTQGKGSRSSLIACWMTPRTFPKASSGSEMGGAHCLAIHYILQM